VTPPAKDAAALHQLRSGKPALVWRSLIADTETPVSAFLKLHEEGRGDFLLESVEGGAVRGRYSLIGLDPDLVFRAFGPKAEVNRDWAQDREAFHALADDSLTALRALVSACHIDVPAALPKALACLVGYFGYETVGLVEKLPRPAPNPIDLPDMLFVRPRLILAFDRLADRLFLVAPVWPGQGDAEKMVASAVERIEAAAARLAQPIPPCRDGAEGEGLYHRRGHFSGRAGAALYAAFPLAAN
jgi:anthranilate synthase component I